MTAATSTADWILAEGWREGLFMQCIEEGAPTPTRSTSTTGSPSTPLLLHCSSLFLLPSSTPSASRKLQQKMEASLNRCYELEILTLTMTESLTILTLMTTMTASLTKRILMTTMTA